MIKSVYKFEYSENSCVENKKNLIPVIGIMINTFTHYSSNIWKGVKSAARIHGGNTVCFSGGAINNPYFCDKNNNKVYELANINNLDGLISVSSSIGSYLSADEMKNFLSNFNSLPLVNIGPKIAGIPGLRINNNSGMKNLFKHLIEKHGYKNIAYIYGPEKNAESEIRFGIYKEILAEYNISYDPELVSFQSVPEKRIVHNIMKKLNKIDVIACFNDNMAFSLINELSRHHINIPYDVAIVGFDDRLECNYHISSLTTVNQPLFNLGYQAYKTVIDIINGNEVAEDFTIDSELIIRSSCGCRNVSNKTNNRDLINLENHIFNSNMLKMKLLEIKRKLSVIDDANELSEIINDDFQDIGIKNCRLILSSSGHTKTQSDKAVVNTEKIISKLIDGNTIHDPVFIYSLNFKKYFLGYILYELDDKKMSEGYFINEIEYILNSINSLIAAIVFDDMKAQEIITPVELTRKTRFSIPEKDAKKYFKVLIEYIKKNKPYTNPDLTLPDLSKNIGVSRNNLSYVINHFTNLNFYDFINRYRVGISKKFLRSVKSDEKILEIAYDSGFNSKSTFYKIFKKVTNMTPTEYRNKFLFDSLEPAENVIESYGSVETKNTVSPASAGKDRINN